MVDVVGRDDDVDWVFWKLMSEDDDRERALDDEEGGSLPISEEYLDDSCRSMEREPVADNEFDGDISGGAGPPTAVLLFSERRRQHVRKRTTREMGPHTMAKPVMKQERKMK